MFITTLSENFKLRQHWDIISYIKRQETNGVVGDVVKKKLSFSTMGMLSDSLPKEKSDGDLSKKSKSRASICLNDPTFWLLSLRPQKHSF